MKGICHTWSRGRHFSPSLPGDRYLNLGSPKKRPPGRNLGEHRSVRRSGTASRGTVVLALCLRMRSYPRTGFYHIYGKKISHRVNKWTVEQPITCMCVKFFNIWVRLFQFVDDLFADLKILKPYLYFWNSFLCYGTRKFGIKEVDQGQISSVKS